MVLGTEHQAAVSRKIALAVYAAKLDDAKRDAEKLGRHDRAKWLDEESQSATTKIEDLQAVIEAFDRQEAGRDAAKLLRERGRRNFDQLTLQPQAVL